jgi:hypothetical protein
MKRLWVILFVLVFANLQNYLIAQLDSLNNLKNIKEEQIRDLQNEIQHLDELIIKEKNINIRKKYEEELKKGFELQLSQSGILNLGDSKPEPTNYIKFDAKSKIIIYPEIQPFGTSYAYRAEYNGNIGWLYKLFLTEENESTLPFNDLLIEKKIEARIKRQKEIKKSTLNRFSQYPSKFRSAIMNGRVMIGMSKKAVIESLGRPSNENKSTFSFGTTTQMVYSGGIYDYVYLENGIVSSFSESK